MTDTDKYEHLKTEPHYTCSLLLDTRLKAYLSPASDDLLSLLPNKMKYERCGGFYGIKADGAGRVAGGYAGQD